MQSVKIRNKEIHIPIIQGGMGVGVSLSSLAGSVMKCGAIGVLSAAHPGYRDESFMRKSKLANHQGLIEHIHKAREISEGNGLLGVNIMVAMTDYKDLVAAAVEGGADLIISGAGLPLELPGLVEGADIAIAPIVSSGKAARLICRKWQRDFNRLPDLIVIEGPKAAGHLGFKREQLENPPELGDILKEVLEVVATYDASIPVFVAGGIIDGHDIKHYIDLGARGVQMGTRFLATYESDCNDAFKQTVLNAKKEDIQLVHSPVGLPGRAIRTSLVKRLEQGNIPVKHCYNCLIPCNPATTDYCISDALISSAKGDLENGLFFCGSEGYRVNELKHVDELIKELVADAKG